MVVVDVAVDDVEAPVLAVSSSSGSGTGGQDGIRPIAASVLTEATNVSGAAGSGRASHGSSIATRILNSAGGGRVMVAVKSKKQFHCRPPPETSSQRLLSTVPRPISSLSSASRISTRAPAASPNVDPPCDPAHPTQEPSRKRTASENGFVSRYGGPPASTPPAAPATAVPVITFDVAPLIVVVVVAGG